MDIIRRYLSNVGIKDIVSMADIELFIRGYLSKLPFSNIGVLLEKKLCLNMEDIAKRLLDDKIGGYCFEHNKVVYEILKQCGFEVVALLARVTDDIDSNKPRTHRITLLKHNGSSYIVDLGLGYLSPSKPVKFVLDGSEEIVTNATLNKPYRVSKIDGETYAMERLKGGEFEILYSFDMAKCKESDFDVAHFYCHRHKDAIFLNKLVLSLIKDDVIYSLKNGMCRKLYANDEEQMPIKSDSELLNIVQNDFGCYLKTDEAEFLYERFCLKG